MVKKKRKESRIGYTIKNWGMVMRKVSMCDADNYDVLRIK